MFPGFSGWDAEGWWSQACSRNGQHCLLCLQSPELEAVSPFWRSWDLQMPWPCHASTAALRGRSPRWQCQTTVPVHPPLSDQLLRPLGLAAHPVSLGGPTLPNAPAATAHGNGRALRQDQPGWAGTQLRRWTRKLGGQLGYAAPASPCSPWHKRLRCPEWAARVFGTECTGNSWHKDPSSLRGKAASTAGKGEGWISLPSFSHARLPKSALQWRAWQAEMRKQREEEQEKSSGSVAASRALLQVRLTNGVKRTVIHRTNIVN